MKIITNVVAGLIAALLIWILYQVGMKVDTLMSVKTEFYFTFHYYLSIIVSATVGIVVGCTFE
jgi:hypothetical protein